MCADCSSEAGRVLLDAHFGAHVGGRRPERVLVDEVGRQGTHGSASLLRQSISIRAKRRPRRHLGIERSLQGRGFEERYGIVESVNLASRRRQQGQGM